MGRTFFLFGVVSSHPPPSRYLNRPVATGVFTFTGTRSALQYYLIGQPPAFIRRRVAFNTSNIKNNLLANTLAL